MEQFIPTEEFEWINYRENAARKSRTENREKKEKSSPSLGR